MDPPILPVQKLSFHLDFYSIVLLALNIRPHVITSCLYACLLHQTGSDWKAGIEFSWVYSSTLYWDLPTLIAPMHHLWKVLLYPFYSWEYKGLERLHGLLRDWWNPTFLTFCSLSFVLCCLWGPPRWWVSLGAMIVGTEGQEVGIPVLHPKPWQGRGPAVGG